MKKWIILISCCLYAFVSFGQNKQINSGDRYVKRNNFTEGISFYKEALPLVEDEEKRQDLCFKIASCYFKMNNYDEAVRWYEDAVGEYCDNAAWQLSLGDALAYSGRLEQAIEVYQKAVSLGADSIASKKLSTAQNAFEIKDHDLSIVKPLKTINSSYSDYAPAWFGDDLVFASTRSLSKGKIDGRTGQSYSNLYMAEFDTASNAWGNVHELNSKLNSQFNEGTFAYNAKQSTAYWMECNDRMNHCVIKKGKYHKEENAWKEVKEVRLSTGNASVGHPSFDSISNVLYFVAEMKDGFGGKDIWKVNLKDDGSWGKPINLGEGVNTEEDELFPHILGDSMLFFASKGRDGFGGLDIFFSVKKGGSFGKAQHLDSPFNSYADDFGLLMNPDGQKGFMVSNRNNGTSDDIYTFEGFPVKFNARGTVKDAFDQKALAKTMIIVENLKSKDVDTVYSKENGKWFYPLGFYSNYELTFKKDTYADEIIKITTPGKERLFASNNDTIIDVLMRSGDFPCQIAGKIVNRETQLAMKGVKVFLENANGPVHEVSSDPTGRYHFDGLKNGMIYTVKVKEKGYFQEVRTCKIPDERRSIRCSKENGYDMDFELTRMEKMREFILSNIYYDFDKASLRETSKIELNKLVSMLKANPEVQIRINSHTDIRGTNEYNDGLSQKRAQSVVNYLCSKGVKKNMLSAKGFGKRRLLIPKARSEEEHQANRRTTFEVLDFIPADEQDPIPVFYVNEQEPDKDLINEPVKKQDQPFKDQLASTTKTAAVSNKKLDRPLEFHIQILSAANPLEDVSGVEALITGQPQYKVFEQKVNGVYKYEVGPVYDMKGVSKLKEMIKANGHEGGFTVAYSKGKRIPMSQAKKLLENKEE